MKAFKHSRDTAAGIEPLEARIAPAVLLGVDRSNHLVVFDSAHPSIILLDQPISGFGAGQVAVGIDLRPANGLLYVVTVDGAGAGRLYTVAQGATATATPVGSPFAISLDGTNFDIDFNPMADRLRFVSDTGQNFRIDPNTGAAVDGDPNTGPVDPDTSLSYAVGDTHAGSTPGVTAIAYTNSFAGATTTQLFDLDAAVDTLAEQLPPNGGFLNSANSGLGVNADVITGFDILAGDKIGYAAIKTGSVTKMYTIDLATGKAKAIGKIGNGTVDLVGFTAAFGDIGVPNTKTLTYRDVDGDKVTIKTSKGAVRLPFFSLPNSAGGVQLLALDLTDPAFNGAAISITAKGAAPLGNGLVNVGKINAAGVDLKALTVRGDLGALVAGNAGAAAPSIGTLALGSIGLFGTSTQSAGGAVVMTLADGVSSAKIATDVLNANINVAGAVKTFTVSGDVFNSQLRFGSISKAFLTGQAFVSNVLAVDAGLKKLGVTAMDGSTVTVGGTLGALSVKGTLSNDVVRVQGTIGAATARAALAIGSITVGGSVTNTVIVAGVAANGTGTNADVQIGAVTVGHDWNASSLAAGIVPGGDAQFGTNDDARIAGGIANLASRIASVTIKGHLLGSPGGTSFGFEAEQIGRFKSGSVTLPLTSGVDDFTISPTFDVRVRELA